MPCPRRTPRILFALSCIAAIGYCAADDIYRTVDARGLVTYSDHAISPASRKVTVDVIAADPDNAAHLARQEAVLNASETEHDKAARQQAQQQQQLAAEQQRQCEAARNRYAMFAGGGRIYKIDDQGNRVFYSDQEIDAERTEAKAAMDSTCPH